MTGDPIFLNDTILTAGLDIFAFSGKKFSDDVSFVDIYLI